MDQTCIKVHIKSGEFLYTQSRTLVCGGQTRFSLTARAEISLALRTKCGKMCAVEVLH